jgi:hypothetical protein
MKQRPHFSIITGALCLAASISTCAVFGQSEDSKTTLLMDLRSSMSQMSFDDLIHQSTGRKVISYVEKDPWQRETLSLLSKVADEVLEKMNAPNSPVRKRRRINEVSRDFEDALQYSLDKQLDWICEIPTNASGKQQRAGYPDLLFTHKPSGRHVYLDPKVYGHHQRHSSLRTFYYEPKPETSKIRFDAMHVLIGFEHDGAGVGKWQFSNWTLVDMSKVKVRLKLEFQTSNRELYQSKSILAERKTSP